MLGLVAFGAGADALIVRDDTVLLGHRMDHDLWVFPGGTVESGESPWDAVVREAAEEVGVHASVIRLLGVAWQPGPNELVFDFLCAAEGEPKPCLEEIDDVGWFPLSAPPPNLFRPQRERLAGYVRNGWSDAVTLSTQDR
jgi:8-oxo-dGTP pyrophosphatase MutT (NUDIX family)